MSTRPPILSRLLLGLLLAAPVHAQPGANSDDVDALVAAGDLAGAREALERRRAEAPEDTSLRFRLAQVLAWQGEHAMALDHYAALLEQQPGNADVLFGRAQAQLWSGQPAAAQRTLQRLAGVDADYPGAEALQAQVRAAKALPPAHPAVANRRPEAELSWRHEWLDSGLSDWSGTRLDLLGRPSAAGTRWYGALLQEQRFGLRDHGIEAGLAGPLSATWEGQLEFGLNPGAAVLSRRYIDLRLQRRLGEGVAGFAGFRHTGYADTRVDRLALGAERYAGSWRLAYTLNLTRVGSGGVRTGHDAVFDRYYRERSVIGLRLALGDEEGVLGQEVIVSPVRSISLQGRHELSPDWSLGWQLGSVRQGDFYSRHALRLGLRRAW